MTQDRLVVTDRRNIGLGDEVQDAHHAGKIDLDAKTLCDICRQNVKVTLIRGAVWRIQGSYRGSSKHPPNV